MNRRLAVVAALAALHLPGVAVALTLDEAIGLALQNAPAMARARAERDGAKARLDQARAERMPSLALMGAAATGTSDLGGFFGFGSQSVNPRSAQLSLTQPLYAGGAMAGAVDQATAGDRAADAGLEAASLSLSATVAELYAGVVVAEQALKLHEAQLQALNLVADQAKLRFDAGEVARTDLAQAEMRRAGARAALAQVQGDLAAVRARFRAVVGQEAAGLSPPQSIDPGASSLDEALERARKEARAIRMAEEGVRAAEAAVRKARAGFLPTVALVAEASSVRDAFLPGYRADGASVGVQARMPLYSGGRTSARVAEAIAARKAAEADLAAARAETDQRVIEAWQARLTAELVRKAAGDQAVAAEAALFAVENEVRVGQKPTLDLLDARSDLLAAQVARLKGDGAAAVAGYRLRQAIGAP